MCRQYELDPRPVTLHDPGLDAEFPGDVAAAAGFGAKDDAELYRIQTEDAWGRWIWLVAELVPDGAHDGALNICLGTRLA